MKLSKTDLVSSIQLDLPDNTTGAISPLDIRRNLINIVDSVSELTVLEDLRSKNLETTSTRTTRLGSDTHVKRELSAFGTADDVAIGFSALKSQIEAARNVAVGSYALTCNMYGEDNVAVGYHSVGNNIGGYANVGIGAFALEKNKDGNFNIAIGHAAGYYIGKDDSYKFYVGPHNVDSDYICGNENGAGLIPFLHGDMNPAGTMRLGIGIRDFVNTTSALQVEGGIAPATDDAHDLGTSDHGFKDAYIHDTLYFNNQRLYYVASTGFKFSDHVFASGDMTVEHNLVIGEDVNITGNTTIGGNLTGNGNVVFGGTVDTSSHVRPQNDLTQEVGDAQKRWLGGHFYNIYVDGVGKFNKFEAYEQTHFKNKTLFLASTVDLTTLDGGGPNSLTEYYDASIEETHTPKGHLLDEDLNDAGLKIIGKGVDYERTYELVFNSQDNNLTNLQQDSVFSRSSWNSNISLSVDAGNHVQTERVLSKDQLNLVTYDSGVGIFIQNGITSFTPEANLSLNRSGDGEYNFIGHSGLTDTFSISVSTPQSGVNLFQRFLTDTDNYETDNGSEKINGFQMGYISDSSLPQPAFFNEQEGQVPHRFIVSSYNQTTFAKRCFTLMQDGTEGYVGISNFDNSESMLPDTILNVRSTGNAIIRTTAENDTETNKAGLEILAKENCLKHGMGIHYIKGSGTVNFDRYNDSITHHSMTVDNSGHLGILNRSMGSNAMLSVGGVDNTEAAISMFQSSGVPVAASGYGQLFTRSVDLDNQSTLLSFLDGSGNLFNVDLTASSATGTTDRAVGLDGQGNTFVGIRTPSSRSNLISTVERNTMYGYEALTNISGVATDNTAIGYRAGKGLEQGDGNVFVGSNLTSAADDGNNIVLGTGITTAYSNNIVMGHGTPTVRAKTDGIDKFFGVNSTLAVFPDNQANASTTNVRQFSTHYSNGAIRFNSSFRIQRKWYMLGNEGFIDIVDIDTLNTPPDATENYASTNNQFVKFNSDLKVRGEILFPNGTKIPNADFITDLDTAETNIATNTSAISAQSERSDGIDARIDALVIEGVVTTVIDPGSNNRGGDWPSDPITVGSNSTDRLEFYIRRKVVDSSDRLVDADNPDASADPANEELVTLRDPNIAVYTGDYVIAIKIGNEYRPISITGQT